MPNNNYSTFRATINEVTYIVTADGVCGLGTNYPGNYQEKDLFLYDDRGEKQWAVKLEAIANTSSELEYWQKYAISVTGYRPSVKQVDWTPKWGQPLGIIDPELAAVAKAVKERQNNNSAHS